MHISPAKQQKKKPSDQFSTLKLFRTSLLFQTKEFFNNSTLHGVRYIAETGRPFGEKFMWFCFTATGAVAALIIIVSLWEKFQTNPTITGLDTDFHNQQVIFPTIIVCPTISYDQNRTWNMAFTSLGAYDEKTADILQPILQKLTKLSFGNIFAFNELTSNLTNSEIKILNKKSLRFLVFQTRRACADTLDYCKYKDEEIKCCDHFQPIYTEHGFCYAFNGRYTDKNDMEERNVIFHDLYETDKKWALMFRPKVESEIFVHSHLENFGWDFRPQITWYPEFVAELLVSMKQTYTTEDAKQLSIVQRKCIFPDEVKLDYYNDEYTFTSCMKECRIKKCMQFCKCIPPFYRASVTEPYCKVEQFKCLAKHMDNITDVKDCFRCELSCSNTVYDVEKLKTTSDPSKPSETFINIEYLTWPIIRYKREVLFGWVDLLVSFGGIAGLFLGFSLLSGVEIIYYFTMRACCMLYKDRKELCDIEAEKLLRTQPYYDLSLKIDWHKKNQLENSVNVIQVAAKDENDEKALTAVNSLPKRLNRANLKLQAARNLTKPNFNQSSQNNFMRSNKLADEFDKENRFAYVP